MARTKQVSLELISGNKRKQPRDKIPLSLPVEVTFNEKVTKGLLIQVDFAKIVLSIPRDKYWGGMSEFSSLLISDHLGPRIDGIWRVVGRRNEKQTTILTLEHSEVKQLNIFRDLITPEITLLHSRFKIYELEKSTTDRSNYATHLTELKDYPFPIECNLKVRKVNLQGFFDFSSNVREIAHLTFKIDNIAKIKNLKTDEEVSIAYVFLGVRYLVKSKAINLDADFGFLNVKLPGYLFSSTARRFDRYSCNHSVQLDHRWLGKMVDISACGFSVTFHEKVKCTTEEIPVYIESLKLSFRARVKSTNADKVTMIFADDTASKRAAMLLLSKSLKGDMVVRESKNYDLFLDLDQEADSKSIPVDQKRYEEWRGLSKEIWTKQDQRFPGNLAGVLVGEKLITSLGSLPLSPSTVYAHSLRMHKTSRSARAMLDIMVYSHVWTELVPKLLFYSGSFSLLAKFTGRMHTQFLMQPKPIRQEIVNTLRIYPSDNEKPISAIFSIEKIDEIDSFLEKAGNATRFIARTLQQPHPQLRDLHTVTHYLVRDLKGKEVAIVFDHKSPPYFTSVDIFSFLWVIPIFKDQNLTELLLAIRNMPDFKSKVMSVVVGNFSNLVIPEYGDKIVPYFWTFTGKEELGPLLGSLSRLAYSVMRKYGEEGLEDIAKAFAS